MNDKSVLIENLPVFFGIQGDDSNIMDGFTPAEKIGAVKYDFIYSVSFFKIRNHKLIRFYVELCR